MSTKLTTVTQSDNLRLWKGIGWYLMLVYEMRVDKVGSGTRIDECYGLTTSNVDS